MFRKPYLLFLCAALTTGACSKILEPQSTITATDLRKQALNDSLMQVSDDAFVVKLNEAQQRFERSYIVVPKEDPSKLLGDTAAPVKVGKINTDALGFYVAGRITQVNDLCKIYFDGLFRLAQSSDFIQNEISLLADLTSGVLGLTGAASAQLAFLALGEAGLLSTAENYEEIYFLAPSPQITYGVVQKSMREFVTANKNNLENVQNYATARDFVRQYAALCTPEQIRRIIDTELADAKVTTQRDNLQRISREAVVAILGNGTGFDGLSEDSVQDLLIATGIVKNSNITAADALNMLAAAGLGGGNIADATRELQILRRYGLLGDLESKAMGKKKPASPAPAGAAPLAAAAALPGGAPGAQAQTLSIPSPTIIEPAKN